jgi:hypothetical protein
MRAKAWEEIGKELKIKCVMYLLACVYLFQVSFRGKF